MTEHIDKGVSFLIYLYVYIYIYMRVFAYVLIISKCFDELWYYTLIHFADMQSSSELSFVMLCLVVSSITILGMGKLLWIHQQNFMPWDSTKALSYQSLNYPM